MSIEGQGRGRNRALDCSRPADAFQSALGDLLEARHGQNEDFAVAHAAGAGDLCNAVDYFLCAGVIDPGFDLDFGQEGQRVLGLAVLFEIILLAAVALYLADGESFERCTLYRSSISARPWIRNVAGINSHIAETFNSASRSWTWRDSAGCDTCSAAAARETLPRSATATK